MSKCFFFPSKIGIYSKRKKNAPRAVTCLEDYACPVEVRIGKLTALDMTPMV